MNYANMINSPVNAMPEPTLPDSQMETALSSLEKRLAGLREDIGMVAGKLIPVMTPPLPPSVSTAQVGPSGPVSSPCVVRLRGIGDEITTLRNMLQDIHSRIEV